jgi:putative sterol carrier protein
VLVPGLFAPPLATLRSAATTLLTCDGEGHPSDREVRASVMATQEDCLEAILTVVERFNSHDAGKKRERIPSRSVGCTILDLDITYCGKTVDGYVVDVARSATHSADLRVLCTSDDLIDLVNGDLSFAHAWSTGRVRLDASLRDLIRLRSLA